MSDAQVPTVEVIVPHRSRWDLLERLLDSLERQEPKPRVCVVDNASTDDSVAQLHRRGDVRVLAADNNLGFARATNLGARTSDADYIVLLNNDMVVEPGFIRSITDLLQAERCSVAAKQLRPDGLIDSVGVSLDVALNAFDTGHGEPADRAAALAIEIAGPSGGAAGFRREDFLAVGGYDEAIFAYLEDVDLAIRLQRNEVPTAYCDSAVVVHHHSETLGSGSEAKNELLGWSRGYLLWKYRRSMPRSARARGLFVDTVVYVAQLFVDRNLGSIRGRLRFRRDRAKFAQNKAQRLPIIPISTLEALQRRARRR